MAHRIALPARRVPTAASRHAQGGVIGLVGIVTLMMALLFFVLAFDTGRLWLERRNLQKIADGAAMESARFTGCGSSREDALAAARRAVQRPTFSTPGGGVTFELTRGRVQANNLGQTTYTSATEPTDNTNGTQVTVSRTVPISIILAGWNQWTSGGSTTMAITARSTAQGGPPIMAFSLGAQMFDISTDQSSFLNNLLGSLLGTRSPNISADGYEGLLGLNVDLGSLMAATGATSLNQLLDMPMPPNVLINAIINANPTMSAASRTALQNLLNVSNGSNATVTLRQVLDVQTQVLDDQALLNTNINVLDLITTSLRIGTSGAKFSFSAGVLGAGVDLRMGKASKLAIGPAGKSSVTGNYCTEARVDNTEIGVNVNPTFISIIPFSVFDFRISLVFAPAVGHAEYIEAAPGTTVANMGVNTGIATVRISNKNGDGPAVLKLATLKLFEIKTRDDNSFFTFSNVPVRIQTPIQEHLPAYSNGSSQSSGALQNFFNIGNLDIKILGLNANFLSPVLKLISDMLSSILSLIVDPMLNILGLNIGSAEIRVIDIQSNQPTLAL